MNESYSKGITSETEYGVGPYFLFYRLVGRRLTFSWNDHTDGIMSIGDTTSQSGVPHVNPPPKIIAALHASVLFLGQAPGRCPGLRYDAPLALGNQVLALLDDENVPLGAYTLRTLQGIRLSMWRRRMGLCLEGLLPKSTLSPPNL